MEKTGDETVDSMFDEVVETKIGSDGKLEVAALAPDSEEMEAAVADMVRSFREFREASTDGPISAHDYRWWKCLMMLSLAEDRLKTAFLGGVGGDRSPASIRLYHRFRMKMVFGKRYRVDA